MTPTEAAALLVAHVRDNLDDVDCGPMTVYPEDFGIEPPLKEGEWNTGAIHFFKDVASLASDALIEDELAVDAPRHVDGWVVRSIAPDGDDPDQAFELRDDR